MKVLITGAFGNIGAHTIRQCLKAGYQVRAFDMKNKQNEKKAKEFISSIEIVWGDLRKMESIRPAVEGVECVIHLAGIIPPVSERLPKLTQDVNVNGTKLIVEAMQAQPRPPKLVFTSSISVFGYTQDKAPPRRVTEPLNPNDNYSRSKTECEAIIRASTLEWVILRLSAVAPVEIGAKMDPIMFDIPLTTRIEFVHPEDVGLALTNAVACKEAIGKTFLIGGGPSGCQMRYRDYVSRLLTAFGLGPLDPKAFQGSETGRFYTDWLDTEESERLLQYQRISFETFAQQVGEQAKKTHILAEMFSPMIKSWLLGKSPYMPVPKWKKSMSALKLKKRQKNRIAR